MICLTSCTIPRIPGARYLRFPLVHTRNHRLEETRERNLSHTVIELTWSQKYWNAHNCNAYSELAILPQPRQRPLSFWSKSQSYVFLGSTIRDQLHAHSVNAHTVPSSTSMHIEKSPTSPESPLWARQDGSRLEETNSRLSSYLSPVIYGFSLALNPDPCPHNILPLAKSSPRPRVSASHAASVIYNNTAMYPMIGNFISNSSASKYSGWLE